MMDEIINYFPSILFIELHGGSHTKDMFKYTNILKEKYHFSKIEPIIMFNRHYANDCLFIRK